MLRHHPGMTGRGPKRDGIKLNPDRALGCCLRMIFSENRYTLVIVL
jgi:hypothetical protein